jgi:glycerophosphoryl diester phosphodiesterase
MRALCLVVCVTLAYCGATSPLAHDFAGFSQPSSARRMAGACLSFVRSTNLLPAPQSSRTGALLHTCQSEAQPLATAANICARFAALASASSASASSARRHSSAAYALAISLGADYIEPDIMVSRDGVAIVMHSFDISETTDVASRAEFAARKWSFRFDGLAFDGWFSFNFTAAELRSLRLRQRFAFRPSLYDGVFPVLTLDDAIKIAQATRRPDGGLVGLYVESKVPQIFHKFGLNIEQIIMDTLSAHGLRGRAGDNVSVPVVLQSFDAASLARFRALTSWPLVQLLLQPSAQPAVGALLMTTPMSDFAGKVDAVAPDLRGLFAQGSAAALAWVQRAHDLKLAVHVWTLRPEPQFSFSSLLPATSNETANVAAQLRLLQSAEVDAAFIENPQDAAGIWIAPSATQENVDVAAAAAWLLALAAAVAFFFCLKLRRKSNGFRPLTDVNI